MKLDRFYIKNFRRLESVQITLSDKETIFVGPNNSGKTSVSAAFRLFIKQNKEFRVHDFSASLLKEIDEYGRQEKETEKILPSIDLDLWFSVDPDTEYGRVAEFLPSLALYTEIGVRLSYSVDNPDELRKALNEFNKSNDNEKILSEFLAEERHLKKYFSLKYFKLENKGTQSHLEQVEAHSIDKKDGERSLRGLMSVDFVDAQRNIDDNETTKSTRLSSILGDYYKANLDKAENDNEAISVIDKSNEKLSEHYEKQFERLINNIGHLGFPSVNDRNLQILSTLKPETALKGNTTLLYVDKESEHKLPESYNGLGFKNLIYIAIQVSHFQRKWASEKQNVPLCQVIFIEEPEVHLHAQVQQVFIRQIRKIAEKTAQQEELGSRIPQLLISTHSSHIIDEGDFTAIRYFQRCKSKYVKNKQNKIATNVLNLANFSQDENNNESDIRFLKKYLKLTHCDLFFSDGSILVEGSVEKLLLPKFIEKNCQELNVVYLTVLEVGGAYAHKFMPLIRFLGLPVLIITDLDSVDSDTRKKCRADTKNAVSSNQTIKEMVGELSISKLLKLPSPYQLEDNNSCIVFQKSVPVSSYGNEKEMIPRTFEESFIYENIDSVRDGKIKISVNLTKKEELDHEADYRNIYELIQSGKHKKTEFALDIINNNNEENWKAPKYIIDGLTWIEGMLTQNSISTEEEG